jgi:UbiD family decarboxylase
MLGSQMYLGLGDDEYDVAGGLLGEPLCLVKCRTVDLEVPADAEIILEGELRAEDRVPEGPVSEFHGFYVDYGPGTGGNIGCVTHRENPVFQSILPAFTPEHCLLGAVAIEAVACDALQRVIPAVRRVFVTDGGMGRLHAIISMHKPRPGEGKRAILLAMGQVNLFKNVIVVEDDIDPEDPVAVEWSLAARFRGHEDLIVLPGVKADRCDPVHDNLLVTKIGMVAATRPGDGARNSGSEFSLPPRDILARVRASLSDY